MKIAFLPIDNRPVCYTLPKLLAGIDDSIEFSIPDRELLGGLNKSADIEKLFEWLKNLAPQDKIILSLDTIAYGGLIPSRRCPQTFQEIEQRINKLHDILKEKDAQIYAFSSIMRIANNNFNIEEKEYWSEYGKKIFEYSYNFHKNGKAETGIPPEILEDYLNTRNRNFEINKIYLKWQKEGFFNTLIFSKDDCAEFGLNVKEAQELEKLGGFIKTGADEIPLSLLSKAIEGNVRICPIFLEPEHKNLISNYEDISVEQSVKGQIELAGCEVSCETDADILLYINNFKERQGEIVMGVNTESYDKPFTIPDKPYMIADVRFANGADNNFVNELLKNKIDDKNFYGYSAWNTTANTIGSLICGGKIKFLSKKYNEETFTKLQITRLLDDWAYQANVRQMLKTPNQNDIALLMKGYEQIISTVFKTEIHVKYLFPWNRLFEVEICQ